MGVLLADAATGRDNNFNLLRALAAVAVVFSHAFGFTGREDPLSPAFGLSFGSLAVNVFFATSGFLIAGSWARTRSPWAFCWARAMRIYPGLWVCVAACLVLGAVFTSLSLAAYLTDLGTLKFLVANATLLPFGVVTTLPGVFRDFADGTVNLPLWTLPYELKMYLLLLLLGATGWLARRGVTESLAAGALLLHAATLAAGMQESAAGEYARFVFFFFAGALLSVHRGRVVLSSRGLALCLALPAIAAWTVPLPFRTLALSMAVPYAVIYLALVPGGAIRRYNRLGDYSYGLYIYGAPAQKTVLALAGGQMAVLPFFILGLAVALPLAVLSWHLVEKRCLARPAPRFAWRGTQVFARRRTP